MNSRVAEITVCFEPNSRLGEKERFIVTLYKQPGDHKRANPPAKCQMCYVNKDGLRAILSTHTAAAVFAEAGVIAELFDSTPVPESRFGYIDVGASSYGHFHQ